ncbi:MAG: hypothetical protein JWM80_5572 [Cyanobacteria bacterium RYN_339]|nr:hypothetical protein [Cyanobacteria bacterium RYN_339]
MLTLALLLAQAVFQPDPTLMMPRPPVEELARALELRAELLGAHAPIATVRHDGTVLLVTPNLRLDPLTLLGAGDLALRAAGQPSGAEHLGVQAAWIEEQRTGFWALTVELDPTGTQALREFSRDQVGKKVGVFVAGILVTQPVIVAPIEHGRLALHGEFTQREAERILAGLQLPWRARLVE